MPDRKGLQTRLRLLVDGEQVGVARPKAGKTTVEGGGVRVVAQLTPLGSISSAEIRVEGEEPVPLDPAPGSRAARREAFARRHPKLFAARHVGKGIGQVLLPLLGIGLLLNLLPDISIDADLPDVPRPDLPSIPFPDIDAPDLPGWLEAILKTSHYWMPILIGVVIAIVEARKRRRQARAREERAGRPDEEARPPA